MDDLTKELWQGVTERASTSPNRSTSRLCSSRSHLRPSRMRPAGESFWFRRSWQRHSRSRVSLDCSGYSARTHSRRQASQSVFPTSSASRRHAPRWVRPRAPINADDPPMRCQRHRNPEVGSVLCWSPAPISGNSAEDATLAARASRGRAGWGHPRPKPIGNPRST